MPEKIENVRNVKGKQTAKDNHRPAGFGSAATRKATEQASVPTDPAKKQPQKRTLSALFKPVGKKKRIKPVRVKREKKPREKSRSKHFGRTELILIGIIVFIFLAASTAVIIINSNKTVHQMPVILRITEEPTSEPQTTALTNE